MLISRLYDKMADPPSSLTPAYEIIIYSPVLYCKSETGESLGVTGTLAITKAADSL